LIAEAPLEGVDLSCEKFFLEGLETHREAGRGILLGSYSGRFPALMGGGMKVMAGGRILEGEPPAWDPVSLGVWIQAVAESDPLGEDDLG
jgi:ABC-type uncharacterized transport system ATPase subunit